MLPGAAVAESTPVLGKEVEILVFLLKKLTVPLIFHQRAQSHLNWKSLSVQFTEELVCTSEANTIAFSDTSTHIFIYISLFLS